MTSWIRSKPGAPPGEVLLLDTIAPERTANSQNAVDANA